MSRKSHPLNYVQEAVYSDGHGPFLDRAGEEGHCLHSWPPLVRHTLHSHAEREVFGIALAGVWKPASSSGSREGLRASWE